MGSLRNLLLIGSATLGLIGGGLVLVIRYYEINKAKAEADHARIAAEQLQAESERSKAEERLKPTPKQTSTPPSKPQPPVVEIRKENNNDIIVAPLGQGGRYTTISEAIRQSPEGSIIKVRPGTYREPLNLHKKIEIIGDGNRGEILIESQTDFVVTMATSWAKLRGLTIATNPTDTMKRFVAVNVSRGKLIIDDCEIRAARAAALTAIGQGTVVELTHCKINGGGGHTIGIDKGPLGLIDDCYITNRIHAKKILGAGILIHPNGKAIFHRCQLTKCDIGIHVLKEGMATVEGCDLTGNTYSAFEIKPGAKVERLANKE